MDLQFDYDNNKNNNYNGDNNDIASINCMSDSVLLIQLHINWARRWWKPDHDFFYQPGFRCGKNLIWVSIFKPSLLTLETLY